MVYLLNLFGLNLGGTIKIVYAKAADYIFIEHSIVVCLIVVALGARK